MVQTRNESDGKREMDERASEMKECATKGTEREEGPGGSKRVTTE